MDFFILGFFAWTTYPPGSDLLCVGGKAQLIWNFTTNESVTKVSWFKNAWFKLPNELLAKIQDGTFITTEDYSTRVSQYLPEKYNAAIQLQNITEADYGEYYCIVKTKHIEFKCSGYFKCRSKFDENNK